MGRRGRTRGPFATHTGTTVFGISTPPKDFGGFGGFIGDGSTESRYRLNIGETGQIQIARFTTRIGTKGIPSTAIIPTHGSLEGFLFGAIVCWLCRPCRFAPSSFALRFFTILLGGRGRRRRRLQDGLEGLLHLTSITACDCS